MQVKLDLNDKGNVHSADGYRIEDRGRGDGPSAGPASAGLLGSGNRPITDAGLRSLGKSTTLQELYLDNTKITDEGFAQVKELPNLEVVAVSGTQVTGAGLVHVKSAEEPAGAESQQVRRHR